MLAVDTLLYTFLAWYFEEVLPTEYGIRRKPWFLFDPLYWKTRVGLGEEETIKKNPIELVNFIFNFLFSYLFSFLKKIIKPPQ